MRLRYAGRCRSCGTDLPAGTDAVYERSRGTVRCVECAPAADQAGARGGVTAEAAVQLGIPADADSVDLIRPDPDLENQIPPASASVPDAPLEPPASAPASPTISLRLRPPASAVIAETLRVQALQPPRTRTAWFFGRDPLSPHAESWYSGALGELEVGRVLEHLGQGWHVIHAIPIGTRGSDIDHLVIGPAGVFTINAKRHMGKVWVGNRMLLVNGQRTHHLRNAEHEGQRAARILSTPVTPLVVIAGARTFTVKEPSEKVVVLRSRDLVRWLTRSAPVLTPPEVRELASRAADPETWGASELAEPDLAAFDALRASRASADRRRRAWGIGVVAAVVASALVVLQNLASIGPYISGLLSTVR
ncbi:MAG: hypothetical protein BGN97_16035 [Microbacterium sp. 69-10]|mgnify:CR=1 FL=1|nr:MAG: hypothetical protein BGN97_16035 [Microbacterium sp. 69-10]